MTTSIPEAPGSGRTWDYRYCWLRDAYYALSAFRLLGHFEEREQFVQLPDQRRQLDARTSTWRRSTASTATSDLDERILDGLAGLRRRGAGAGRQRARPGSGRTTSSARWSSRCRRSSSTSASAPSGRPRPSTCCERLARKAIAVAGTPDAGIWELPQRVPEPQTFSSLMCWAAADRMANVAARARAATRGRASRAAAGRIRDEILARAWSAEAGSLRGLATAGRDLDAALLQMASLRFLPPDDPRLRAHGRRGPARPRARRLAVALPDRRRLRRADGRLRPLHLLAGRGAGGRSAGPPRRATLLEQALPRCSPLGLLSEDYAIDDRRHVGQLPAGLLARRPDPRRLRRVAALVGGPVSGRAGPPAGAGACCYDPAAAKRMRT